MPKYTAKINKSGSGSYIPVTVETDSRWNAEELIKAQYPGYEIYFLEETIESNSTSGNTNYAESSGPSLKGAFLGIVLLVSVVVALYVYDVITGSSLITKPRSMATATPTEQIEASAIASSSVTPEDNIYESESAAHVDLPPITDDDGLDSAVSFPFRARIVDKREAVVLQSEPGITSRNIAKLATGTFVDAASQEGKWIYVSSANGLRGYVRLKQLEFVLAE